jgi:MFS transporter, DHA2 family, multidrug resistance protein
VIAASGASQTNQGYSTLAIAALVASFMQAVTVSIPNAALLYIEGATSMADDEIGWIFTAYLAAGIVTMTMARWLAGRFGRKVIYQIAIVVFAIGLILATCATTPLQFIAARIIQGGASGILGPLSLAILIDLVPPEQQARLNLVVGITLMVGLLAGPAIGGWLSEYHDWRSIFYVILPLAGFVFLVVAAKLTEKRAAQSPPLDFFGVATLLLGMIALQMLLDRGERLEWFNSTEIWVEAIGSVLGFYLYFAHILTREVHFLDTALFKDRNFAVAAIMYFAFGFVLLPTIALTSPLLDEVLNYPADTTGYLSIPRSLALVAALILSGRLSRWVDNRVVLVGGLVLVIYANWRMIGYSPQMDWRAVVVAGVIQGAGLGVLLPALTRVAFSTLGPTVRAEGMMLFNVSRFYGSTIGIALVQIFFYDNTQAMHLALAKNLTPFDPATQAAGLIGEPGLATLNKMVTDQAAFVGIIDQFKVMLIAMLIVSPLVLLLRKPLPAQGKAATP